MNPKLDSGYMAFRLQCCNYPRLHDAKTPPNTSTIKQNVTRMVNNDTKQQKSISQDAGDHDGLNPMKNQLHFALGLLQGFQGGNVDANAINHTCARESQGQGMTCAPQNCQGSTLPLGLQFLQSLSVLAKNPSPSILQP